MLKRSGGRVGLGIVLAVMVGACRQKEAAPVAPSAPKPSAVVEAKVEKVDPVARGRYLAESVLVCGACHTARDYSRYGGPVKGEALAGDCFGEAHGMPVQVCASNITSDPEHGIGRWTDEELMRAMREGRGRDGRVLFPMMPYADWKALSDEDARAVVAYLRQVPAVARSTPRTQLPPEMAAELQGMAVPLSGPVPGPKEDLVARGQYLATLGQCATCHAGMADPSKPFSGGIPIPGPFGKETAPSLHPEDALLRGMSEDAFVARFKAWKEVPQAPSRQGQVNKLVMPWVFFAGFQEEDLRAIHRYLRSLPGASAPSAGK
ncbi:c-type cytochrome [Myxococcus stipitatus]|uniref:c-type cytochrome n=1 Tax=Myxococcus stipitatus TaxID=83455 RepID=UPI0031452AB6